MALWLGIMIVEDGITISREIHGPYEDVESMAEAADERTADAEAEDQLAVLLMFELFTDDVPEVVGYDFDDPGY